MENFTNEEISIIIQLMDIATKAGGLQVAQQALPIAIKLQKIIQSESGDPSQGAVSEAA